jgi:hypothetical protein
MADPLIRRTPRDLAKQLGLYADAITGFVVLQAVAYCFLLGNKEFHDAVHTIKLHGLIPTLVVVSFIMYSAVVYFCHQGEDALYGKPTSATSVDEWVRLIRLIRFLAMFAFQTLVLATTILAYK